MTANVLEINGLEKHFGEKQVLKGLDLIVPEKKVFGFVGIIATVTLLSTVGYWLMGVYAELALALFAVMMLCDNQLSLPWKVSSQKSKKWMRYPARKSCTILSGKNTTKRFQVVFLTQSVPRS